MSAATLARRVLGKLVRPLLRRASQSETLRRALIPLMLRFPTLQALARRLSGRGERPRADLLLPVWPAPLPAEYLELPASSRQTLLDLARATQQHGQAS